MQDPPKCRLEPVGQAHAETMSRWMEDPALRESLGIQGEASMGRTVAWIEQAERDATFAAFAIDAAGRHVGNVVLDRIGGEGASARLSVYIGDPSDRDSGIGSEALRMALDEAFGPLGLERVWLTVHEQNASAVAAYEKVGFVAEEVLPGEFTIAGEKVDGVRMAVAREAWEAPTT